MLAPPPLDSAEACESDRAKATAIKAIKRMCILQEFLASGGYNTVALPLALVARSKKKTPGSYPVAKATCVSDLSGYPLATRSMSAFAFVTAGLSY